MQILVSGKGSEQMKFRGFRIKRLNRGWAARIDICCAPLDEVTLTDAGHFRAVYAWYWHHA